MRFATLLLLIICLLDLDSASAWPVGKASSGPANQSTLEQLPFAAPGSLGIWLVGVVIAGDGATNLAIIEHATEREQRAYREGDRPDGVLIKRILPDAVIVDAGQGDRRLPLQHGLGAFGPRASRDAPSQRPARPQTTQDRSTSNRRRIVRLDRDEVAVALRDPDRVLRRVDLSPIARFGEPAGFRITGIPPRGILARMGLRDGDIVKRVDDEEITHPEQAEGFLRRIREGGDVTVTVKKRRRTRHIVLRIH